MRHLAGVAGLTAFALFLAAIEARMTDQQPPLTPRPETVAEQFLRTIENKRFSRGSQFLASGLQQKVRPDDLRGYLEEIEQSIGKIEEIKGTDRSIEEERASAIVTIETDRGDRRTLTFDLQREDGLWKISSLPLH